jgi:ElaA protein
MEFQFKTFHALNAAELYEILQLRNEVFIVEQNCAYQDLDGKDEDSYHLTGRVEGRMVAYARILNPGASYKEASIGRVVVSAKTRGKNYGLDLMIRAIEECCTLFKCDEIVISAQKYLLKFYNDLGFREEGDVYLEDDIPHIKMRWRKSKQSN